MGQFPTTLLAESLVSPYWLSTTPKGDTQSWEEAVYGFHFIIGKELESDWSTTARIYCCDVVLLLKIACMLSTSLFCTNADIPVRLPWLCREDDPTHTKLNHVFCIGCSSLKVLIFLKLGSVSQHIVIISFWYSV